jgi:hypothetical protein
MTRQSRLLRSDALDLLGDRVREFVDALAHGVKVDHGALVDANVVTALERHGILPHVDHETDVVGGGNVDVGDGRLEQGDEARQNALEEAADDDVGRDNRGEKTPTSERSGNGGRIGGVELGKEEVHEGERVRVLGRGDKGEERERVPDAVARIAGLEVEQQGLEKGIEFGEQDAARRRRA